MPRLRHKVLGVTVNVDDETAALMKGAYEPADEPTADEPTADEPTAGKTEKTEGPPAKGPGKSK